MDVGGRPPCSPCSDGRSPRGDGELAVGPHRPSRPGLAERKAEDARRGARAPVRGIIAPCRPTRSPNRSGCWWWTTSGTSAPPWPSAWRGSAARSPRRPAPAAALEVLRLAPFDLAFLDLRLGAESGLDLLPRLLGGAAGARRGHDHRLRHLRHRGGGGQARRGGLPAQALHARRRSATWWSGSLERRRLTVRLGDLEARLGEAAPDVFLETASPRMRSVLEVLEKAAPHDASILLRGESGTGKGVLARALHALSPRRDKPVRHRQLPHPHRRAARQRALRPRPRRLHRRGQGHARPRRGGRGRHALPRRDRRDLARRSRPSSSASCRSGATSASARPRPAPPTSASWPPPTATSRPR